MLACAGSSSDDHIAVIIFDDRMSLIISAATIAVVPETFAVFVDFDHVDVIIGQIKAVSCTDHHIAVICGDDIIGDIIILAAIDLMPETVALLVGLDEVHIFVTMPPALG